MSSGCLGLRCRSSLWCVGVVPMINRRSLAVFCQWGCWVHVGVSEAVGHVLWFTFDVVNHLFVVVCGCGSMINLPIFCCMHDVQVCGGMYEALGVSSGCLGDL